MILSWNTHNIYCGRRGYLMSGSNWPILRVYLFFHRCLHIFWWKVILPKIFCHWLSENGKMIISLLVIILVQGWSKAIWKFIKTFVTYWILIEIIRIAIVSLLVCQNTRKSSETYQNANPNLCGNVFPLTDENVSGWVVGTRFACANMTSNLMFHGNISPSNRWVK